MPEACIIYTFVAVYQGPHSVSSACEDVARCRLISYNLISYNGCLALVMTCDDF